jgi:putative oligomerization/nucleic acid binding protein
VANDVDRETRRKAHFARLQGSFPFPLVIDDVPLPDGGSLDEDEFVIRTAKDWGVSVKPLYLTTRRLVCPSDLMGHSVSSLRLSDVRSVTFRKQWIGLSSVVVETIDRRPVAFAAHINGPLVRSDISATVDHVQRTAAPGRSAAEESPSAGDRYDQLRQIGELKQSGVLSEAEFQEEKARILKQP